MQSVTNYMEMLTSWEAASRSATRDFSNILWNSKAHYRAHRSLIHFTPPHPVSLTSILIVSFYLRLDLHSGLLPSGVAIRNLYEFPFVPMRATCRAPLIFIDFIILIIFGGEYK
jgi:hypothetical protein